jgi:hypothetical protein
MRIFRGAMRWLLMPGVLLPVSFVTTITLLPLWRWIEAEHGVEPIGHSGPAEWCFWTVYAVWITLVATIWMLRSRSNRHLPNVSS